MHAQVAMEILQEVSLLKLQNTKMEAIAITLKDKFWEWKGKR